MVASGGELPAEEADGRFHGGQCGAEGSGIEKLETPGAKREAVAHAQDHDGVRERHAINRFWVGAG